MLYGGLLFIFIVHVLIPLLTWMAILFGRITSQNSSYAVVAGDHLSMVSDSAMPIDDWLIDMGL